MLPKPRTEAAAEMESERKPLAAASIMPRRAISCFAEQAAHSERESSGRDVKLAEVAGGGERHANQGDQLRARRAAACAAQRRAKAAAKMESELKPQAVASLTPVWAIS